MAMEIPFSRNKVIIPALRPEILRRARLIKLFDDLLDKKLIIVNAPAGYGKTSLLIDFSRHTEMPVCWLSLDVLDRDLTRFCTYLIASLEERFPRFGKQSRAALKNLTKPEQDYEWLLMTIINEIETTIDCHFAFIVDDYQYVDSIADVRNLFGRFIFLAGENCHVILASRRLPALPDMTVMVARQQVGGFDLEQLAFRSDEIRALFEQNYRIPLSEQAADELTSQTEGWITGLLLSAPGPSHLAQNVANAARTAGVDLAEFFDRQVLSSQSAEMRAFLLHTSVLDEFDHALCEAIFGAGDWRKLCKAASKNNLFILPVGRGGKWLRYHPLFKEFLQARLQEEEPYASNTILSSVAGIYTRQGEWEKAYAIIRAANNPDLLADLIESAGKDMLLREQFFTLRAWLEELPSGMLGKRPVLRSLKGTLLCTLGEARAALEILDQVILELHKNEDIPQLAFAYVSRAAANRMTGDYASSLEDSEEALSLCDGRPGMDFIAAEAKRFKGISLHSLGQVSEAIRIQTEALQQYELSGDKVRAAWVRMELGMNYRAAGNYSAAQEAYEHVLADWKDEGNLPSQADVLNSLGVLHHNLGEYEKAIKAFESGLRLARSSHAKWQEALLLTSMGDMYTDLDEFEPAGEAYKLASEAAQNVHFHFLSDYLGLAQARLERLRGEILKAGLLLQEVESPIRISGSHYEGGMFHLERGCLRLIVNDLDEASHDLEQALDYFQFGGLTAEAAWSQIWLAAADLRCGRDAPALSRLKQALCMNQMDPVANGLAHVVRRALPWFQGPEVKADLEESLIPWINRIKVFETQLPAERKRLRKMITILPLDAPALSIQAFGRSQVKVRGDVVTPGKWKSASARDLFFYLLTASRSLSKDEIGEILWPESEMEKLNLSFKNSLYRLRHAIGAGYIVYDNNLYYFNRFMDYEYDIENFLTLLEKARFTADNKEKIAHLSAALQIRHGPFLRDLDATWVIAERERLERTWLNAARELTELLHQSGDLQSALKICQQALEVDGCREDLHQMAMQLHHGLGDRLGVIWQYQACCKTLRAELDIKPSETTTQLFHQLTE